MPNFIISTLFFFCSFFFLGFLGIKDLLLLVSVESLERQLLCKDLSLEMMKPKQVCCFFFSFVNQFILLLFSDVRHNHLLLKEERESGKGALNMSQKNSEHSFHFQYQNDSEAIELDGVRFTILET